MVFFDDLILPFFPPSKNSAKKNVFSGAGYLPRKQMHKRVAQMEPLGGWMKGGHEFGDIH